jgi:hypothetical protein
MRRRILCVLAVGLLLLGFMVYRQLAGNDLPLRKGMTHAEVEEALGTSSISGGSASMTHDVLVYDLDTDCFGCRHRAWTSFDPETGHLISWGNADSRFVTPPWVHTCRDALGW